MLPKPRSLGLCCLCPGCHRNQDGHSQDIIWGCQERCHSLFRLCSGEYPTEYWFIPPHPPEGMSVQLSTGFGDTWSTSPQILEALQPWRGVPVGEFLFFRDFKIWLFKGSAEAGQDRFSEKSASKMCALCWTLRRIWVLQLPPEKPSLWNPSRQAGAVPRGACCWGAGFGAPLAHALPADREAGAEGSKLDCSCVTLTQILPG